MRSAVKNTHVMSGARNQVHFNRIGDRAGSTQQKVHSETNVFNYFLLIKKIADSADGLTF